jgi:hypothetical protein
MAHAALGERPDPQRERRLRLKRYLEQLTPVYLDELSASEAAEYIGVEPNAVSQLKLNALKKLVLTMGA